VTEETPRERDKRLRHLAKAAERLNRSERRRIERLIRIANDQEIMRAADPALKRKDSGGSFISKRWFGGHRYEVGRHDVKRLVAEGRLKWGNEHRSYAVPA